VPAAAGRVAGVDGAIVRVVAVERMVAQAGAVAWVAFIHGAGVAVVAIATRGLVNAGPRGSMQLTGALGVQTPFTHASPVVQGFPSSQGPVIGV